MQIYLYFHFNLLHINGKGEKNGKGGKRVVNWPPDPRLPSRMDKRAGKYNWIHDDGSKFEQVGPKYAAKYLVRNKSTHYHIETDIPSSLSIFSNIKTISKL